MCVRRVLIPIAAVVVALTGAATVQAQILDGATPPIELNFSTPGARSLGMGGAFIGLADDATAAYANPAGLTILRSPEVSLEGRMWDYTATFPDSGHFDGSATGSGIDTVDGLVNGTSSESVTGLSFLSYVRAGEGWAFALYGHKLANFQSKFRTQGPFVGEGDTLGRLFPVDGRMDLEVQNYGASLAFTVSENFSIGVGASYYDFSFDARTDRYDFIADPFGPADYSSSNLFASQVANGSGSDWGFNVGFLWRATEKFQLGGVYRDGPSFDFSYRGTCGPSDPDYCSTEGNEFTTSGKLHVPTVYGLGIAIKPSDALTVTVDWDHVAYSDLEKGFAYVPSIGDAGELQNFSVSDGDEYHIGLEYGFINLTSPLLLRAGAWLDPAHATTYSGSLPVFQALWSAANSANDQWHYTGGLGFVLAQGKFQIDLAADVSDRVDTYSLSGVYRF